MTWWIGIGGIGAIVALATLAGGFLYRRTSDRIARAAADAWRSAAASDRESVMRDVLATTPDNAVAWFLLGCAQIRMGRIKDAARSFGMAYHFDVDLESAAMMTFACLKSRDGEASDILNQIAVTWDEMKRPNVQASASDRRVFGVLLAPGEPAGLSPLGRLVWALIGDTQRAEISAAVSRGRDDLASFFD